MKKTALADLPRSAQHRSVHAEPQFAPHPLPAGPIAVLPTAEPFFVEAVTASGGVVTELSSETRAVIWLTVEQADELGRILDTHPNIAWVQLPWAGVDAFRDVIATHPRVFWTSAKGAYAQPVAEHALMLTLALLRVVPARLAARSWRARKGGRSLFGMTVCVVGAGGIARVLAELLRPFEVQLRIVRRTSAPFDGADLVTTDLAEGITGADIIILAAAHTAHSERMFNASTLALLGPDTILVNVARGALVDTDALVAALQHGRLGGAGIDVTDPEPLPDGHPLWTCPNTIVTPHSADTPEMTAPLLAERVRFNVASWLAGGVNGYIGVVDPTLGY